MSLRDEARANAQGGSELSALDRRKVELRNNLWKMEEQFQLAMPKGMEAKQLIRDAMTCFQATPGLATCDMTSVLGALMTCSQLGLRPGVLGQAWVIPMGGKGQLIIGYKGYAALAQRTRVISDISVRVIRENDEYDYEFGLDERLVHRPKLTGPRGEPVAFYSVARTNTGGKYWELMGVPEMEDHRDRFAMGRKKGTVGKSGPYLKGIVIGPWVDDFVSMAKKTVVLRTLNLAPASTELQYAFDVDGSTRFDLSPHADVRDVSVIEDTGQDAVDGELDPAEPTEAEWAAMQGEQK